MHVIFIFKNGLSKTVLFFNQGFYFDRENVTIVHLLIALMTSVYYEVTNVYIVHLLQQLMCNS